MIIVSLHHTGDTKLDDILPEVEGTGYQGQPERFLAHIEQEVMPFLQTEYRITEERILAGWSRFGIFTTFALTERPSLFSGFIVRSSAQAGETFRPLLYSGMQSLIENEVDLSTVFYFTIGTEGNEVRREEAFNNLKALLEKEAPDSFRWQAAKIDGAGHSGTFQPGLKDGLLFYFSGR